MSQVGIISLKVSTHSAASNRPRDNFIIFTLMFDDVQQVIEANACLGSTSDEDNDVSSF